MLSRGLAVCGQTLQRHSVYRDEAPEGGASVARWPEHVERWAAWALRKRERESGREGGVPVTPGDSMRTETSPTRTETVSAEPQSLGTPAWSRPPAEVQ